MKQYIYSLSDPISGKVVYIGKTKNIKRRYSDHCRRPKGSYRTILDKWKKEIIDSGLKPQINIIKECDETNVDFYERFYISEYRKDGILNMTDGGDGLQNPSEETRRKIGDKSRGRIPTIETRQKISKSGYNNSSSKKILCYDIDSNFIGEFINSRRASEKLNISYKQISSVLNGVSHFSQNKYTFFYADDIDIQEKLKYKIESTIKHGKRFFRIDKFGIIEIYDNLMIASKENNCNFRNIWLCLNYKRNNCGGYGWVYEDEYDGKYQKIFSKKRFSKKIYSTLLDMEFSSAVEAAKYTGINKSSICNYLKGKQNPKNGDIWKYI